MRIAVSSSMDEPVAQVLGYALRRRGHDVSANADHVRALDGVV
jgi:hypothetical protein